MLPFVRLLEYGNVVSDSTLIDIDFTRQQLGDTFVTDARGHVFSKVGTGTGVVQNDPSHGLVMTFDGLVYFSTPMMNNISLSQKHFEMRMVFKCTYSGQNIPFSTGDYYTVPTLQGGFDIILFHSFGTQLFATDDAGLFTRCPFDYTLNAWADMTFTWLPTTNTMTITNNDTHVSTDFVIPAGFGNGTQMALGASYTRPVGVNTFIGSIKSLVIKELVI